MIRPVVGAGYQVGAAGGEWYHRCSFLGGSSLGGIQDGGLPLVWRVAYHLFFSRKWSTDTLYETTRTDPIPESRPIGAKPNPDPELVRQNLA